MVSDILGFFFNGFWVGAESYPHTHATRPCNISASLHTKNSDQGFIKMHCHVLTSLFIYSGSHIRALS